MFMIKANVTCNNTAFIDNKITPSALAKALNVSPQTVKNWSSRGISKEGAMAAQAKFGCDANELREKAEIAFSTDVDHAATKVIAMEPARSDLKQRWKDPYVDEALGIFLRLAPEDRKGAVAALRSYVQNLGPPRDGQTLSMAV